MAKKKMLKKQKGSNKNTPQLKDFNPQKTFKEMSPQDLYEVLFEIWLEKDLDSFKGVLSSYLEVHNKQKIAKEMGVSRSTLYHIVSEEGNPTLDTLFNLMSAIENVAA